MESYEYKDDGSIGGKSWEDSVAMMRAQMTNRSSWTQETLELFVEQRDAIICKWVTDFLNGKKFINWDRVPANQLKYVWADFGKLGFVRNEKMMNNIASLILKNIAALDAGNALSGHSQEDPREMIECAHGIELDEDQMEKFQEYLALEDGTWIVSDYGLPYLHPIYQQIMNAKTAEDKLYAVDRALNVVHQRGDLADFFVEGGSKTLNAVFVSGESIPKPKK